MMTLCISCYITLLRNIILNSNCRWFLRQTMFADHWDSATKTRAAAAPKSLEGRPPAWPKYHLENLQATPENHLAKKSHKPQSLPARPARRTSRNDRWISTKNLDDRQNFWSFTFAKDSSNLICKKPPASPRTSCGYLRRGKLLPMQKFFDSLRIETQRGLSFEAQTALDAPNLIA